MVGFIGLRSKGKYRPATNSKLQVLCKENSIHLGDIDVSQVTDMSRIFMFSTRKDFSGIESWDVSQVTDISSMFWKAIFFNADLSKWDVSNVINMTEMFYSAFFFNADISAWNVSKV